MKLTEIDYRWKWADYDYDIRTPFDKCPHCGKYKLTRGKSYNMRHTWYGSPIRESVEFEYLKCGYCEYYKRL